MAKFRLRFKLNPERPGVGLAKLSKQTENIEMFLRSLAADLGISDAPNMWLAKDFKNGSCISTAEHQAVVEADAASKFNLGVEALTTFRPNGKRPIPSYVSAATVGRFAAIRHGLDVGEPIGLATFNLETGRPNRWHKIERLHFEEVAASVDSEVLYIGSIMGATHDWVKGAKEPYITIREINTSELIKCTYADDDYPRVAKLFANKTAIVVVGGTVLYNRITGKTEVTMATSFDLAPEISDDEFERFFGCSPSLTGAVSTDDFIRDDRDDE